MQIYNIYQYTSVHLLMYLPPNRRKSTPIYYTSPTQFLRGDDWDLQAKERVMMKKAATFFEVAAFMVNRDVVLFWVIFCRRRFLR